MIIPLEYKQQEYPKEKSIAMGEFNQFCSDWASIIIFKPYPIFYMFKNKKTWKRDYMKAKRRFFRDFHEEVKRTIWAI